MPSKCASVAVIFISGNSSTVAFSSHPVRSALKCFKRSTTLPFFSVSVSSS